jgi:hypothetical protein
MHSFDALTGWSDAAENNSRETAVKSPPGLRPRLWSSITYLFRQVTIATPASGRMFGLLGWLNVNFVASARSSA